MGGWKRYYKNTEDRKTSKLLIRAVNFWENSSHNQLSNKPKALDLGCGAGIDSLYLLERGFEVLGLDRDESCVKFMSKKLRMSDKFEVEIAKIEEYDFFKNKFDVINARFVLPFIDKKEFNRCWDAIICSLRPGGVFTGQLFGENDSWNSKYTKRTFLSESEVKALINRYQVFHFKEVEREGKDALGKPKHWHVFHFGVRNV